MYKQDEKKILNTLCTDINNFISNTYEKGIKVTPVEINGVLYYKPEFVECVTSPVTYEYCFYQNQSKFDSIKPFNHDSGYNSFDECKKAALEYIREDIDFAFIFEYEFLRDDIIVKIQSSDREEIELYKIKRKKSKVTLVKKN